MKNRSVPARPAMPDYTFWHLHNEMPAGSSLLCRIPMAVIRKSSPRDPSRNPRHVGFANNGTSIQPTPLL